LGLADVAAGLAGIVHGLTPTTAPGLPYTQHPDDSPEPLESAAATRSRLFCIRWPGTPFARKFIASEAMEYPAQDFELRISYARGDWTTELEMRAAMAQDASALFAALYPVAAWDSFATDLHISTDTGSDNMGAESGSLAASILILRGTAEWEA
jgi:hypothetical protein